MTRREVFAGLAALVALPSVPLKPKLGAMTVDRWHADGHFGKRILLDGRDITDDCCWFDDSTGEADLFLQPVRQCAIRGAIRSGPAIQRVTGRIEIRGQATAPDPWRELYHKR